jgi:hypothetical protein
LLLVFGWTRQSGRIAPAPHCLLDVATAETDIAEHAIVKLHQLLILAGALLSITVDPIAFDAAGRLAQYLEERPALAVRLVRVPQDRLHRPPMTPLDGAEPVGQLTAYLSCQSLRPSVQTLAQRQM